MPAELLNILVQIPVLVLFMWYMERNNDRAERQYKMFQDYMREERKVTLDALEKLTTEIVKLGTKIDDTDNIGRRAR